MNVGFSMHQHQKTIQTYLISWNTQLKFPGDEMIITKEIKHPFYILCQQSTLCMILKYNVHFSAGRYISRCRNLSFVIKVA